MTKTAMDRPVQLSVLDRLTEAHPQLAAEERPHPGVGGAEGRVGLAGVSGATMRSLSLEALKGALRRDLEWLLNTRRTPAVAPEALGELARSVYHYGLPDMTSLNRESPRDRERLLRHVEEAVATFEPRLSAVRVTVSPAAAKDDAREVRFVIEGLLRVDPAPERVVFDTVLETPSGEYRVRDTRGA